MMKSLSCPASRTPKPPQQHTILQRHYSRWLKTQPNSAPVSSPYHAYTPLLVLTHPKISMQNKMLTARLRHTSKTFALVCWAIESDFTYFHCITDFYALELADVNGAAILLTTERNDAREEIATLKGQLEDQNETLAEVKEQRDRLQRGKRPHLNMS